MVSVLAFHLLILSLILGRKLVFLIPLYLLSACVCRPSIYETETAQCCVGCSCASLLHVYLDSASTYICPFVQTVIITHNWMPEYFSSMMIPAACSCNSVI